MPGADWPQHVDDRVGLVNAPADCRRMSSALSANDCASGESPSLAASALSALAFRAIRDRECARVSCASAAMASASCWLVRSVCRVAACVVAALAIGVRRAQAGARTDMQADERGDGHEHQ